MRIATWNVNSLPARLPRLLGWLASAQPDVLVLQETKVGQDGFPVADFAAVGYECAHRGQGRWNGVAVLSRVGIADVESDLPDVPGFPDPAGDREARYIAATCAGVRVAGVYVPNGRTVLDPHFGYKLGWLGGLAGHLRAAATGPLPFAVMGDFNIAPTDDDVWSMEYYADKSHVSPGERAAFHAFLDAGFVDVVRPHAPGPGVYTYWDYQRLAFQKRRGMRIDFVLGSPSLAARVAGAVIDREERKGTGASDHAPVVVQLDA